MRRIFLLVLPAFFSFLMKPAFAENMSKEDIEKTFAGMTVEGYHHKKDFDFKRYYAPNGELMAVSAKKGKRTGTWNAKSGKLCEEFTKNKCNKVKRDGDSVRKYNKKGKNIVTYKSFTEGNNL